MKSKVKSKIKALTGLPALALVSLAFVAPSGALGLRMIASSSTEAKELERLSLYAERASFDL